MIPLLHRSGCTATAAADARCDGSIREDSWFRAISDFKKPWPARWRWCKNIFFNFFFRRHYFSLSINAFQWKYSCSTDLRIFTVCEWRKRLRKNEMEMELLKKIIEKKTHTWFYRSPNDSFPRARVTRITLVCAVLLLLKWTPGICT